MDIYHHPSWEFHHASIPCSTKAKGQKILPHVATLKRYNTPFLCILWPSLFNVTSRHLCVSWDVIHFISELLVSLLSCALNSSIIGNLESKKFVVIGLMYLRHALPCILPPRIYYSSITNQIILSLFDISFALHNTEIASSLHEK